jgi:hypothetical protein
LRAEERDTRIICGERWRPERVVTNERKAS